MSEKQEKVTLRKRFAAYFTKQNIKSTVIPLLVMGLSSIVSVIFTVLCMENFQTGFLAEHKTVFTSLLLGLEVIYIIAMTVCFARKFQAVYKLLMTGIVLLAVIVLGLFIVQETGVLESIDTVEELRDVIQSAGSWWAPVLFILLQILQVCILPIPGVLSIGAGVLVFDVWLACLYSYIGILIGSVIAFWIGRVLGYRVAAWVVGKETLDKWLQKVKGRDKMLLTAMFLLPLFPDDVLCVVSGLTTMSWKFFIFMQLIARAISVVTTVFSLNGDIIPYDQLWGIIVWICIGIAIIALFVLIWKKGDKFERWFYSLFRSKKGNGIELSEKAQEAGAAVGQESAETGKEVQSEKPAAAQAESAAAPETEEESCGPPQTPCEAKQNGEEPKTEDEEDPNSAKQ